MNPSWHQSGQACVDAGRGERRHSWFAGWGATEPHRSRVQVGMTTGTVEQASAPRPDTDLRHAGSVAARVCRPPGTLDAATVYPDLRM